MCLVPLQDQDGLVHFTWSERSVAEAASHGQELEVDVVVLPGDASFRKIPGRRIFVLKHGEEELFFW